MENEIQAVQASQHYRQQPQLFWNSGEDCPATFVLVDNATTGDLAQAATGRGAAKSSIPQRSFTSFRYFSTAR